MTGKGIMEALSFVEERYIEEAENGAVVSKRPVVRVLLPLAACLCLILTGLHFIPRQQESQKDVYSSAVQETGYASNVEMQEHKENFEGRGISAEEISQTLREVLQTTPRKTVLGEKPYSIYTYNGENYLVAYGSNGYIVSFYPYRGKIDVNGG